MIYDIKEILIDHEKLHVPKIDYVPYMKTIVFGNEGDMSRVNATRKRPTVLLLPGGGYQFRAEREAEPVAAHFLARGFNVCILYYSVAPAVFPTALIETLTAIREIRKNCTAWYGDPDKIFVCGFSAGGHLAASAGILWNHAISQAYFGDTAPCRPNGMILSYPVITSDPDYTHGGSFDCLLGDEKGDPEKRKFLSLETQVNADTVPAFIWSTFEDKAVPCESSLRMACSMREHNIPFELHVFEKGPHGTATGDLVTCTAEYRVKEWLPLACDWIESTRLPYSAK